MEMQETTYKVKPISKAKARQLAKEGKQKEKKQEEEARKESVKRWYKSITKEEGQTRASAGVETTSEEENGQKDTGEEQKEKKEED